MKSLRLALWILVGMFSSTAFAQNGDWNGTWSGKWGNEIPTSIVIKNNKVVEYMYKGNRQPVGTTDISGSTLTFGNKDFRIILRMREDSSLADAEYNGPSGHGIAVLTASSVALAQPNSSQSTQISIQADDLSLSGYLFLPEHPEQAAGVLVLHGWGGNAEVLAPEGNCQLAASVIPPIAAEVVAAPRLSG